MLWKTTYRWKKRNYWHVCMEIDIVGTIIQWLEFLELWMVCIIGQLDLVSYIQYRSLEDAQWEVQHPYSWYAVVFLWNFYTHFPWWKLRGFIPLLASLYQASFTPLCYEGHVPVFFLFLIGNGPWSGSKVELRQVVK